MPIPQLKSNFKKRKVGGTGTSFRSHRVASNINAKRRKKSRHFSFPKKVPKLPSGGFWSRLIRKTWPYALGLFFLAGIFIIGLFAWYSKDLPEPGKIMDRSIALSTKIYDRTGEELLYEVHGPENRTLISIEDIPQHVIDATIAIEDKNFYSHKGISLWGIIRGQIMPRLQGKRTQGGSTLTQQFVKNAILTNERRLSRKIKEWILSYQIEKKYDKQQILEFYFNEIPYGGSVYGVEAASRYYFDKSVEDITIAEAAILAALPQAPTAYSPYGSNKDVLINRQHTILNLMVDQDYIIEEQAESAKQQELVFKKRAEQIKAPHFVMYIRELLEEKYGTTLVEQSGWKIITSLDWKAQELAQAAIDEIAPQNLENYEANNAALVAIDVNTSEILAMIGSKDYFDDDIDGQVNVVLANRQPGSSMKPLAYLAAFMKGYRPETILFDLVTNFAAAGEAYIPHNYDLEERGPIPMRQALAGSVNIPAVKTLYLAGIDNILDLTTKFGYTTLSDRSRFGLSLVLGGGEVKLLEHTNAYATFAREGVYKETVPILKIEDSSGKVIEENTENKGRRVVEKNFTRILSDILSDNGSRAFVFGENNYLTLGARPVAAKTGTTNDYRDAWTIGYTPDLAAGVWVGHNDSSEMKRGAAGSNVAAPIWNKFMREVTQDMPIKGFAKEELGDCDKPMVCGELGGSEPVRIDKMSGKLATEYTPYTQIEEKKYLEVHNILHYVNTNDPLGNALDNPSHDPQYNLWEEPVKKWAEEQGYTTDEAPTEYDDVHLPELQPSINLTSPSNNKKINKSSISMSVNVSAPRGVERVEYFLDDEKIGQSTNSPFSLTYQLNPFIKNGEHRLKAIVFDDLDNFKEDSITINLQVSDEDRSFNVIWLEPTNGDTVSQSSLPINLSINIDQPNNLKKVDFYYIDPDDNSKWFAYWEAPVPKNMTVAWGEGLSPGVYKLYMIVKNYKDERINTPAIIINIE